MSLHGGETLLSESDVDTSLTPEARKNKNQMSGLWHSVLSGYSGTGNGTSARLFRFLLRERAAVVTISPSSTM